jgi:hypothetical protein
VLSGCGLVDALAHPNVPSQDHGLGTGDCSSTKQGGCDCIGTCACDGAAGDGCHCQGDDCVIASHDPVGCGTLTLACFGAGCQCAPNDDVTCLSGQACEIRDADTQDVICASVDENTCHCQSGSCSCLDGDGACCQNVRCN